MNVLPRRDTFESTGRYRHDGKIVAIAENSALPVSITSVAHFHSSPTLTTECRRSPRLCAWAGSIMRRTASIVATRSIASILRVARSTTAASRLACLANFTPCVNGTTGSRTSARRLESFACSAWSIFASTLASGLMRPCSSRRACSRSAEAA